MQRMRETAEVRAPDFDPPGYKVAITHLGRTTMVRAKRSPRGYNPSRRDFLKASAAAMSAAATSCLATGRTDTAGNSELLRDAVDIRELSGTTVDVVVRDQGYFPVIASLAVSGSLEGSTRRPY